MTKSDIHPPSMKEEMERLGISEETMASMKRFFMKTSVPRLLEEMRKEEAEKERQVLVDKDLLESKEDKGEV